MKTMVRPSAIIIHHSATKDGNALSADDIKRYHKDVNGWEDVGYHVLIEKVEGEWGIFPGRPITYQGAHCSGHNNTIGICLVGNYDNEEPQEKALNLLAYVVSCFLTLFGLKTDDIFYHNQFAKKTCPGSLFQPLEDFRKRVAAKQSGGKND